ncbi:MAG: tRNA 4-thiouridine(8) synthase ThiI [Epsilonproteobacteria bacterium]|nr:MAG: tRNA 4-thiouridine(8) synthase ThiI [Campylobacterota bacterium]RLA67777.1 MAG: tRNA 4-thiouridine(8) synthase ThiI [Campylobacterota bacterium]
MYNVILINVDELWLKGKNRNVYFKTLKTHAKDVLKSYHQGNLDFSNILQRLVIKSETNFSDETIKALESIPGIHSINLAREVEKDLDKVLAEAIEEFKQIKNKNFTFKVFTARSDKTFPQNSMEVNRWLGHHLLENFPDIKVDVHDPEVSLEVKILPDSIFISTKKLMGIGGQPLGASGHLVTMLSGGLDSPVASFLMAKRGCKQTFAFFYSYPFVGEEVLDKILKLTSIISKYQRRCKLYIIPFGEFQKIITKEVREEYRTVMFRKFMIDCSNLLAQNVGAQAILTGDALGQVSSQTIGNIALLDQVSQRPIFRPLIGFNKAEIVQVSKEIGTYETSIIPHDDACSLFAPKHPIIRPNEKYWNDFTRDHPYTENLIKCLEQAMVYDVNLKGEINPIEAKD